MYPKDYYAAANLNVDTGLCFVLMPFAPKFDEVWEVIRNTVGGPPFNLLCRRADDISRPGHILTDVLENMGRARLLIADLSGQNPNVFYELGVAHSIKEASAVILISADLESVPFDLRHLRTIIYHNDYGKLRTELSAVINEIGIKQYAVVLKEGESGRLPRLTGDDHCLYEIEIEVNYIGDDGVKFELRTFRYVAGSTPFMATNDGYYLGLAQPALKVPGIPWNLCYSRTPDGNVRFILGRHELARAREFESSDSAPLDESFRKLAEIMDELDPPPLGHSEPIPDPMTNVDYKRDALRLLKHIERSLPNANDPNKENWAKMKGLPDYESIEGLWSGRWKETDSRWHVGTAHIQVYRDWVNIRMDDETDRYVIRCRFVKNNRLVGRYMNCGDSEDNLPWVGIIVNNRRIDGFWRTHERWDFRR